MRSSRPIVHTSKIIRSTSALEFGITSGSALLPPSSSSQTLIGSDSPHRQHIGWDCRLLTPLRRQATNHLNYSKEMQNLRVEHWHQWEQLCCYFMERMADRRFKVNVRYHSYGSKGQSQFGIDLVPSHSDLPFVGQCKLIERSFTWSMALNEVEKTDGYDNPIERYIIFTTAPVHTTVQDQRNRGGYMHTRPNGSQFSVEVCYWSEISNINFIPQSVLREIFPDAFRISAQPTPPLQSSFSSSPNDYLQSLNALKRNLPNWITRENLAWLETWDFGSGYVQEADFEPFNDLFIEHSRTVAALNGIPEWLHERDRALIAECLPAGNSFFFALNEFKKAIVEQSIAQRLLGKNVLTLDGLPAHFKNKVAMQWKNAANELAMAYRREVLGESRDY